ncbi:GntR family transcriptional regulator [Faecalicatena sp. AGMB00832]|uniref:GntR family transcriptional regulator n=1 Tax=Faecalicatena faecalis TaxID=2726362 RepID=A0ABS6D3C9_9FIRM|nr:MULTISPECIES: GntR family transcriptional regulator [Faecalicatena]MBU3875993.1 GntR family transcriptional regulator [Faecalicatena faecalis]MCI6468223.1 GntR family transcriptional regulator [Faecalicatena sp.]MDY5620477.1 GntR family transcriptional regulator [Lachnospiraceae bacterium]
MITIDYQSRAPIYEQIVERFQMLILKGVLRPDDQMPSVRSLAVQLSINPNTIQKAYTQLEQQGYIYPVKGRGNFVSGTGKLAEEKKEAFFQDLDELLHYGKELGITMEECRSFIEQSYRKEVEHD